jgi:hypothetical protein
VVFLFTRGLPTFAFFRRVLSAAQLKALSILSSTGLPLIVVITTIGVDEHKMKPQNASALAAAGMLSVLVYPILGSARSEPAPAGPPTRTRCTRARTHDDRARARALTGGAPPADNSVHKPRTPRRTGLL